MRLGENCIDAAIRGLGEELRISKSDVKIVRCSDDSTIVVRDSHSYPGLQTKYVIYQVEAIVANLPATEFWTHEVADDLGEPATRHQWRWISEREIHKPSFTQETYD